MTTNTVPQPVATGFGPARRAVAAVAVTGALALAFVGGRATVDSASAHGPAHHAVTAHAVTADHDQCRFGRPC